MAILGHDSTLFLLFISNSPSIIEWHHIVVAIGRTEKALKFWYFWNCLEKRGEDEWLDDIIIISSTLFISSCFAPQWLSKVQYSTVVLSQFCPTRQNKNSRRKVKPFYLRWWVVNLSLKMITVAEYDVPILIHVFHYSISTTLQYSEYHMYCMIHVILYSKTVWCGAVHDI